jgi:hypothetical protein
VSDHRVQRIGIRDGCQPIRLADAGAFQDAFRQPLTFQCAPTKVRVQAIESLFVDIHDHDLVTSLEEVITQFRAHTSAPYNN